MKPTHLFLPLAILACVGCAAPPTERAEPKVYESQDKILYVGGFYDLRERRSRTFNAEGGEGEEVQPSSSLVDPREVRTPLSEVRSVLADALDRAHVFRRVLNPPFTFAGSTPNEMIRNAQQSSDYLLVGEINQFYVKSIGYNETSGISIPLDLLLAPLSFATFLTTGGNMYLFSGALMAPWDAEVTLSLSLSLIDTATGNVVHTARVEERVRSPYDGLDAFGAFWDEEDDWIDLGRRLGEIALHNAGVRLSAALHEALGRFAAEEASGD
jgi:hypothetical protein